MAEKLTAKERRFVEEYCVDFNTTQAAMRAGYSGKSRTNGFKVINRPRVAAAIEERRKQLAEQTDLTVAEVKRGLKDIAIDPEAPHAARVTAWTQLGRHLGMFVDKTEHTGKGGGRLNVTVIYEDAKEADTE